mmetsp:Transcript_3084/g.6836  ORF Transcript_3084/g.6836 Transcript_3084/m.6836 type:complete len:204 (+) Transcript_3084:105-716(+)
MDSTGRWMASIFFVFFILDSFLSPLVSSRVLGSTRVVRMVPRGPFFGGRRRIIVAVVVFAVAIAPSSLLLRAPLGPVQQKFRRTGRSPSLLARSPPAFPKATDVLGVDHRHERIGRILRDFPRNHPGGVRLGAVELVPQRQHCGVASVAAEVLLARDQEAPDVVVEGGRRVRQRRWQRLVDDGNFSPELAKEPVRRFGLVRAF